MNQTLSQINEKYNDDTYPVFPFISKTRITILAKGLYRKHKASFRGITAVYDNNNHAYKYPLYGMYHIPEDLIIVPEGLVMTDSKTSLLQHYLDKGFTQVEVAPKFHTLYFPSDSIEAKLALANKIDHQTKERTEQQQSVPDTVPDLDSVPNLKDSNLFSELED